MNSNKNLERALAVAAVLLAPLACRAADGLITINGKVVDETCTIGTPNFSVSLPTISKVTLGTSNAAGLTQFSIVLTNCVSVVAGSVSAYFEPDPSKVNAATGRLKNATGTATNVEVELLNSALTFMNLTQNSGGQNSTSANVSANGAGATLTYYAQYRAVGTVTSGTVGASVNYTITYP